MVKRGKRASGVQKVKRLKSRVPKKVLTSKKAERKKPPPKSVARELRRLFAESGYAREPILKKRKKLGAEYKKGYEIRLVVSTRGELKSVRTLLRKAGFRVCKEFEKHSKLVQPVYGYEAFAWFTGRS